MTFKKGDLIKSGTTTFPRNKLGIVVKCGRVRKFPHHRRYRVYWMYLKKEWWVAEEEIERVQNDIQEG